MGKCHFFILFGNSTHTIEDVCKAKQAEYYHNEGGYCCPRCGQVNDVSYDMFLAIHREHLVGFSAENKKDAAKRICQGVPVLSIAPILKVTPMAQVGTDVAMSDKSKTNTEKMVEVRW